ncbi:MAG: YajQ family cyclic di-GMP-binding protein [Balneolaceae bacterium]|jgi:uncharacterized protein YajQ (UPF0234 family)
MPSFDIVNKIDVQEVDNAVNNTRKEVNSRYDFRGLYTEISFNRKENSIQLIVADDMKLQAVREILARHFAKRKISPKVLDFKQTEGTSQGHLKQRIELKEGISKETAKLITKEIKGMKLKVQPAIQETQVRVTGKKIDDLQSVIKHLKSKDFGIPMQFVNMK